MNRPDLTPCYSAIPAIQNTASDPWRGWLKRVVDCAFGLALLPVALPIVAIAWVLVRITSDGPGFYSQLRVGLNGRNYRIFKIRTMYRDCEAKSGIRWSTKGDDRITPIGRILRKLHIDELPQLWNVLCGDMSLVGPRPERPEFVGKLARTVPGYADRLLTRPGVTGLAQIQLPPDTDIESVRRKIVLDKCYISQQSLWLDLRILFGTCVYLLGVRYTGIRRVVGLPNPLMDLQLRSQDSPTAGQSALDADTVQLPEWNLALATESGRSADSL